MSSVSGYNSQYNTSSSKVYYTEDGHKYWLAEDDNSSLDIQDFFSLIAAQLSNQDFMNPTDNTEFMSQLAQFTALQMQESILYASNASFASSLVGKTVVAAKLNDAGELVTTTGVVTSVLFANNGYEFVVDGKSFSLENLMEVRTTPAATDETDPTDPTDPADTTE